MVKFSVKSKQCTNKEITEAAATVTEAAEGVSDGVMESQDEEDDVTLPKSKITSSRTIPQDQADKRGNKSQALNNSRMDDRKSFSRVLQQSQSGTNGEKDFQAQQKRPNKGSNKGSGKPFPRKQSSKGGTGESSGLRAGPSSFQLQITNINRELGEEDIKEYLKGKGVEASRIEDKSSEGWETKRFLLTLQYEHFDTIMKPEFWPSKIYFKRWFPVKEKTQ